jgi:CRISPR-associated endonuclease/helicase Cas3
VPLSLKVVVEVIDAPPFEDFYRAANVGRAPFPWQARLAERLRRGDGWPSEIGVPTGLGKTACIDVAIWWLAYEADRDPKERSAPTRIWWLVNRRLLVDATTEHVERLSRLLIATSHEPSSTGAAAAHEQAALGAVAMRLRAISARPDALPIEVVRLRGGVAAARPTDASQPAILLSTVPMYGSRLLYRGYGVSRSMRPVDAGLAGTDSLVLVDEAHLAHHLMQLFAPLGECDRPEAQVLPVARARPVVVSLTATGAGDTMDRFDLDADDLANPMVQGRLHANKLLTIDEPAHGADPAKALAGAACELLAGCAVPSSCVVFANTPVVARGAFWEISKMADRRHLVAKVLLLTGRNRERESAATREQILDPVHGAPAERPADAPRDQHFVVVATQTLEVGADLDFDVLVTEACGVRALTQRLGRLNRLGRRATAPARYVHILPKGRPGTPPGWPVYGEEPLRVLERLRLHAEDGTVDLCPQHVAEVLGLPGDDPGRAPEVLPALLAEWAKTSQPPPGEAPVEPFFSGLAAPELVVNVAWRAHLPAAGMVLWPRLREEEAIELPLGEELRDAVAVLGEVHRLKGDRASIELVDADRIRPGDTLLLPTSAGLLDGYGWDPTAREPVVDVSVLRAGLPLDAEAIRRISGESVGPLIGEIVEPSDEDDVPVEERVNELLSRLAEAQPPGLAPAEWQDFLASLSHEPAMPANEVPRLHRGDDAEPFVDELDELSLFCATSVALEAHCDGVAARAAKVAEKVGVVPGLVEVVARAGRFHDVGKADERFQQWLDPYGDAEGLVAKSRRPRSAWARDRLAAGWPEGGRHEALSGRLVREWLHERQRTVGRPEGLGADLLVHLVVSHHGWGRPLIFPAEDGGGGETVFELEGTLVRTCGDLATIDWEQPGRFRRLCEHYGYWGLALLEAVVRQSDHAVSAAGWAGGTEVV